MSLFIIVSIVFTLSSIIPIQLFFNSETEIIFFILIILFAIGLIVLSILVAYQINKIIVDHNKIMLVQNYTGELQFVWWNINFTINNLSYIWIFYCDYSFRGWFSDRISTAVNESVKVAKII